MHIMGMQVCVHKWVPGNRQGRVAMISSGGSEHEASKRKSSIHFSSGRGQFFCFSFSYSFYLRSRLACDHTLHRLMKQTLKPKKKEFSSLSLCLRPQSVLSSADWGIACSGGQGSELTSFIRQGCRFAHALSTDLPSEAGHRSRSEAAM